MNESKLKALYFRLLRLPKLPDKYQPFLYYSKGNSDWCYKFDIEKAAYTLLVYLEAINPDTKKDTYKILHGQYMSKYPLYKKLYPMYLGYVKYLVLKEIKNKYLCKPVLVRADEVFVTCKLEVPNDNFQFTIVDDLRVKVRKETLKLFYFNPPVQKIVKENEPNDELINCLNNCYQCNFTSMQDFFMYLAFKLN